MKRLLFIMLTLLLVLPITVNAAERRTLYDEIKNHTSGKSWETGTSEWGDTIITETTEKNKKVYVYTGAAGDEWSENRDATNNFAVIGNTCFRILRTTYKNGTKLLYYGEYKDGSCTQKELREPIYDSAYINFAKDEQESCNEASSMSFVCTDGYHYSNSSLGYMYRTFIDPTIDAVDYDSTFSYDETHKNEKSSNAKEIIDAWYSNNLLDYTNWFEDDIYCNNRQPDDVYDDYNTYDGDWDGTGFNSTTYKQSSLKNYNMSLECPLNDSFTVKNADGNKALTYPVGMLSLDEVLYATSVKKVANRYGNNDYYSKSWIDEYQLTMTPYRYEQTSGGEIYMFTVNRPYGSEADLNYSSSGKINPVVSVKELIEIESGTGPKDDPYILTYPDPTPPTIPDPETDTPPQGGDEPEDGPQVKGDDIDLTNPKTGVFMYLWILPIIALVLYIVYVQINKKGLFKNKYKGN